MFEQAACASSQLVGGKGSQLALLTSIQNKVLLHAVVKVFRIISKFKI